MAAPSDVVCRVTSVSFAPPFPSERDANGIVAAGGHRNARCQRLASVLFVFDIGDAPDAHLLGMPPKRGGPRDCAVLVVQGVICGYRLLSAIVNPVRFAAPRTRLLLRVKGGHICIIAPLSQAS